MDTCIYIIYTYMYISYIYVHVHISYTYLSIGLSIYPSIYLTFFMYLSINLYLSFYPSIYIEPLGVRHQHAPPAAARKGNTLTAFA